MRRLLCAVTLCLAVGCGPDFRGTYSGTLLQLGSCSDGSSINHADAYDWTFTESGSGGEVTFEGACSGIPVTYSGSQVTFGSKTCAPSASNGVTVSATMTDGTGTLDGKNMGVSVHTTAVLSSASASGSCTSTLSGTLIKK